MQRTKMVFVFLAVMLAAVVAQAQSKEWLHVLVNDTGKEETVRINVPIALMETLLPMIQEKAIKNGKVRIDDKNISKTEMKKLWTAVKQEGDTEYLTVEKPGQTVRISMQGKFFVIQTDENSNKMVDIRIPAAVMDAMLAGDGNEFNLMAAAKALRESGIKDIVSVKDHDSTVRVWIDNNKQAL